MCGRLTVTITDKLRIQEALPWLRATDLALPRYNVAPSQEVTVVLNENPAVLTTARWGLIPHWARDPAIAHQLINARAETLAEKPSFRDALRMRRCLLLADGFYEWAAVPGMKTKQPYFIQLSGGRLFTFAGLWERWRSPEGEEWTTCTIVTTAPNELLARIHNRMPVILTGEDCRRWLAEGPPAVGLLASYPAAEMTMYPVSTLVNNPRIDDPGCIVPL